MPEGHVSHRNAQRFTRCLVGRTITAAWSTDPRVRVQRLPERLVGESITGAEARGKHHLLRFASGRVLVSHLMMSGVWHLFAADAALPRARVMVGFSVPGYTATLVRCPHVRLLDAGEPLPGIMHSLGPDLLDLDVDSATVTRTALGEITASREIGDALLDQRVVSGIGNVYKSESLFLAGVDRWRSVGSITPAEAAEIGAIATELLRQGTRQRGPISTYDPPGWLASRGPSGQRWVYGRAGKPCRRCGARVRVRGQGDNNRSTYWCPGCQR